MKRNSLLLRKKRLFLILMIYLFSITNILEMRTSFATTIELDSKPNCYINNFFIKDYFKPSINYWGTGKLDVGFAIALDSANNILITGTSFSESYGIILLKYSVNGSLLWNVTFGENGDMGFALTVDRADFIYVCGDMGGNAFLCKFTPWGDLLWTYNISGDYSYSTAWGVAVNSEGNVIVTGESRIFNLIEQAFIHKVSPVGEQLWNLTWGEKADERALGVDIDRNDEIFITGLVNDFENDILDVVLLKVSKEGQLLWNYTYDWGGYDIGLALTLDKREDYIYIVGETSSYSAGARDFLVTKISSRTGKVVWFKSYGGVGWETAYKVAMDEDGNLIVAGRTGSVHIGNWDFFLGLFSSKTGELLFEYSWGGESNDECYGLTYLSKGALTGIFITGSTCSFGKSSSDIALLIFLDSDGDFLTDAWEQDFGTDPLNADTDFDGLNDYQEIDRYSTDPFDPDSDDDGWFDGKEVSWGTDPLNPASNPQRRKTILSITLPISGITIATGVILISLIVKKNKNK
ncbi:MAG TPA: hypothetical protein VMZ29_12080 [Candidatus Bathyarchaeia archaeon]|nr:hypothetical protein [Candidatus Bathyarchaeia archaeon]